VFATPRSWSDTNDYSWNSFVRTLATDPAVQDLGDFELVKRRLDPEQAAGDLGFETKQTEPGTDPDAVEMRVGFIRPGGPAATTELAIGDVIETVDGKAVGGADSMRYYQLTRVPAGTQLVLGINEGKTVTITVGPPIE
jgi:C-terminal processing protease CtpA/Prc